MSTSKSSPFGARPRVAIVGAGVCGLGIGWRLAAAGCPVQVFDRGQAGHGATWAAAGMLAGGVECEPGEAALLALTRLSQDRWPAFARELAEASGIDPEYRDQGTLVVALTRDDVAALRFNYDFQQSLGIPLEWLSGAEARRREPHLRPGTAAAVFSPNDHQVENRRLALGLKQAFLGAGGRLHEETPVEAIAISGGPGGGRARGLQVDGQRIEADVVVLAAGAWSRGIAGLPPEALPPVRPVKGQMLALQMDPAAPLLSHVLWAPGIYLVPRRDGRLLVGATVEEKGFDERLTAGGVFSLIEAAWRAVPTVEELPIAESWVGFRPTSRDDAPILGPTPVEGLVLATGHHRNGILLAPVTADAVSRFILTGELAPEIAGFGLERFARVPMEQAGAKRAAASAA
jgi:glycine oxidase